MLLNTLSTPSALSLGNHSNSDISISDQGIEVATGMLNKQLTLDSSFPSLLEMLDIPAIGGASVSGLNERDYPSAGDSRISRHLHTLKKVPLPADLLHHFQHMQCNCMMGLFPEIGRAWLTIDSDIYVWLYGDGADLAYFDSLHDTILSVGLVKPKPGVFKNYIEYLLCLTTFSEIVLLGVSFGSSEESGNLMHLLPDPLFSVNTDGAYILTIKGTKDGRIFLGSKDGCLWELLYQAEDGWFGKKCQKINHSKSLVSYILPSFLTLSEDDPVSQIEIDDSRHILYTLTEKSNITVYDLGPNGSGLDKVLTLSHCTVVDMASKVAKTIDQANFKNIIAICPVNSKESLQVHFIAITGTGVRLYYTTSPLNVFNSRPCLTTLLHIRLPPGFAANASTHRPTRVHKTLYSQGITVLCASESSESDVIWTMSRDQYPYHSTLTESQAVLAIDGYVWALADITPELWCSALNPPTAQGTEPPLLVTQHQQAARQLVLLSTSGAHIFTTLRPIDQLKLLFQELETSDSSAVKDFFQTMTPTQACATALIIAMDAGLQDNQVKEHARNAMFQYGYITSSISTQEPFQDTQSPGYCFHPNQMSTPMAMQTLGMGLTTHGNSDPVMSPLHNALYLYLSRVLRPVWSTALVKEQIIENKLTLLSTLNTEEVSFLARKIEFMCKFMTANQGTSNIITGLPTKTVSGFSNSGNLNERSSLLSLKVLLTYCLEILRLWTVLNTHNFSIITSGVSKDVHDQLKGITLQDLILSGKDICRNLIMALMNRYHGDNASIDAVSNRLREICPSLFKLEDAKLSKANEIILTAKNNNVRAEKESLFREAVELCKQIGHSINIGGICSQLASGGCYEGIVDLCLSVAAQRDPFGQGQHYYKNNQPTEDPQGYYHFTARMECYRVTMEHINQLIGTTSNVQVVSAGIPQRPGPLLNPNLTVPPSDASQYAEQMISLIVNSSDELAHVTLYQWLLDTSRTERLLSITSPFIESFLKSDNRGSPLNDLLWKYYERNEEYYNAAKILYMLTDQSGDTTLTVRIEYLCRALMCLSASQMNTETSYADFMLHLEEKKDVAKLQLKVLHAIKAKGGSEEIVQSLNAELIDVTTLYEKYAEQFDLWESKLAIVHCAGLYEPQLIQNIWTHIIDDELKKCHGSLCVRADALSVKLKSLAYVYSTSPNYFPLEHIIKTCELSSVKLGIENNDWVVKTLQSCGIPVGKLISVYNRLYSLADSIWEVERAPYHLLKVLAHTFNILIGIQGTLPPQERRALKEQCLDYIATYLTDLGVSADQSAGLVSSHLKTCQVKLEKVNM